MKIAFFVQSFPLMSETFILNQIMGLIDRGHKVDIFANEPGNFQEIHTEVIRYRMMELVRYMPEIPQNYFLRIIKVIGLVASDYKLLKLGVLARALNYLKYGRKASSLRLLYDTIPLLRQNSYDVIHCQFGTLGPKVLLLKEIGAITGKLVTTFRGSDATKYLQNKSGIYDELFKKGDLFLTVSQSLKKILIEEGCEERKIVVLHSGIDCNKFEYHESHWSRDKAIKVLTVARLVEKKGVDYAIRAIAQLIDSGYHVTYDIIGDGKLQGHLKRLIEDLGIETEVRLLGWKTHEEVIALMREAHVLIAPSVTATDGDQEGIPNAIKEAMAVGLPVISTFHSGITELVEDGKTGFLVPERDIDALSDRLMYLADHPEKWQEMGYQGRMYVEGHYDINKLNDRVVDLYGQLLDGKHLAVSS